MISSTPKPNRQVGSYLAEFLRFLATGGVAALANLVSRPLFEAFVPYEGAIVISHIAGMAVAYLLARKYVFPENGQSWTSQVIRFGLINVASLFVMWAVSVGLLYIVFPAFRINEAYTLSHFLGVASTAVPSYFGHKYFSFGGFNDNQ